MRHQLRTAKPSDKDAIIDLITRVYTEYGETMCLEGADADLLDVDAAYAGRGGAFVVIEIDGQVVGTHATLPTDVDAGQLTFRRLYLATEHRGTGLGYQLMQWAIDWSIEHGFKLIEFWSDTRFERAHAFFARLGFKKGETREMTDAYEPYHEYRFTRPLDQP